MENQNLESGRNINRTTLAQSRQQFFSTYEKQKRSINRDLLLHLFVQWNEVIFAESLLSLCATIVLLIFSSVGMFTLVILFWNIIKLIHSGVLQKEKLLKRKPNLIAIRKSLVIMAVLSFMVLGLLIFSTTMQNFDDCTLGSCDSRFILIISTFGPL
jgi:hypothetical protein